MKKTAVLLIWATFVTTCVLAQNSIMDFYKAQEKDLKRYNQPGGDFNMKVILIKQDVKNGFISYKTDPPFGFLIGVIDDRTDMGYFVSKNGKKFAASSSLVKIEIEGIRWSGNLPTFHKLVKGELIDITKEFLSIEKSNEILNSIPKEKIVFTKIPQVGTTIKIGSIDPKIGESSFQVAYEMLFNVNDGTFRIVKK